MSRRKEFMMSFEELNLAPELLRAVAAEGYQEPTPIQAQSIPPALEGRDLLGCAQTGTGKTAAFALPILQRLSANPNKGGRRHVRALILTPTRELASQIGDSFIAYGKETGLRGVVIFGGVGQKPQTDALRRGIDILVATPGRLIDLKQQGFVDLRGLEVFVLDEADRMLDMGFIHDVRKVVEMLPQKRQTLFFSATMPPEIKDLADTILVDPVHVAVAPPATTVEIVDQSVYFVEKQDKIALLGELFKDPEMNRVLVFTRTKHGADKVTRHLERMRVKANAIHGNKSQNAREAALDNFKKGGSRALVATDIASRGLDIECVSHVVNFDLPNEPESYVHRIGRTARAGASGTAISFCSQDERPYLRDIERLIQLWIRVVEDHPHKSTFPAPTPTDLDNRNRSGSQQRSAPRPAAPQRHTREKSHGGGHGARSDGHKEPGAGHKQRQGDGRSGADKGAAASQSRPERGGQARPAKSGQQRPDRDGARKDGRDRNAAAPEKRDTKPAASSNGQRREEKPRQPAPAAPAYGRRDIPHKKQIKKPLDQLNYKPEQAEDDPELEGTKLEKLTILT